MPGTESSKNAILKFLNNDYPLSAKWIDLFTHFILLDEYNVMPNKGWYEETEKLIDYIGNVDFIEIGVRWINDCLQKSKQNANRVKELGSAAAGAYIHIDLGFQNNVPDWVKNVYGSSIDEHGFIRMKKYAYLNNFQNYFYQSLGGRILRGFIHAAAILKDKKMIDLVEITALANPNTSQDAIHVYSLLDKEIAVPKLTVLKAKVTNKNCLARINKVITAVGSKAGLSKAEVEESVVPDFGINEAGEYIAVIGGVKCNYKTINLKDAELSFENENGKVQKTLPSAIKENFASEFKNFKKTTAEIKQNLNSHRKRIEEFYLIDRKLQFEDFESKYLNNNLIRILAKDLIWNFQKQGTNLNLIFSENGFVDSNGMKNRIDLAGTTVSLWHPIGFDSSYVLHWRDYILENEILQPFKQAFREIYVITDAEVSTETYSNRFASHILKKDHVSALAKTRGWSPAGIINDGKISYKIPGTDLKAEYWVGDVDLGERSRIYGSAHVSTDQVRFYKKKIQMPLVEIPATVFSEVMRDVDLFVGVTSIGNDPDWYDRGNDNVQSYWTTYSNAELTESSSMRAEILKNIIPKMKIGKVCSFEGKYLLVKGKIKNYRIHMGSGNILMEPNDKYLCIVADRSADTKKVFIPYEGDHMLSLIISKAVLLADDDKIKDSSIISQISI